jgi:hypothetical protein
VERFTIEQHRQRAVRKGAVIFKAKLFGINHFLICFVARGSPAGQQLF